MNDCRCGRPTRDNAYVCDTCSGRLARALGDIPWLADELETTIARQKGIDYRSIGGGKGGKKPAEMPHPANMAASDARSDLKAILVAWTLFCDNEKIRHSSPLDGLPADTLPALSRWLMWRIDGLTLHEIGPDAVDEIGDAVTRCHRIVDRPADRQYLGTCDACTTGRMYATPGAPRATCQDCEASTDANAVREKLLDDLDDRLCTAAEIAHLSTYLGLQANREQVRKRVNQWHNRGRISREASLGDEVVFRFGIVRRLLVHEDERAKQAG